MNPDQPFRIVHVNIRGIRANRQNLIEFLRKRNFPEIVTINESKLNAAVSYSLPNYYIAARRDSSHGHHGSLILVKASVKNVVSIDNLRNLSEEVIGIRMNGSNQTPSLNICTYYNPPRQFVKPEVFSSLKNLSGPTLLLGDVNCKNEFWGSTKDNRQGNHLLEILNDNQFIVLNNSQKTRYSPQSGKEETLDIAICNTEALRYFQNFHVDEGIGSDHYPILLSLALNTSDTNDTYRNIKVTDWNHYQERLINIQTPQLSTATEIDNCINQLANDIIQAFHSACPEKTRRLGKKTSFTIEMRQCVKE